MAKNKKRYRFDSVDFVIYLWDNRKLLLGITLLAGVASTVASLLITPKFESQVVLFPTTSASISKTLLAQSQYNQEDNLKFGGEQESEQLMQVLNSEEIKGRIIHKFNLPKHYKIDTTSRFWRTKLNNEYGGNITFKRTEYMSIVIDVLDPNPDTAAFIANEISYQVDSVITHVQRQRAQKSLAIVENEYLGLQNEIGKIKLPELLKAESERLSNLKAKYMEAKVDAEQTIPHKFVIDKAYASEKKAYPKRLIIILVSTISSFFVALLLLIIRDSISYKNND